MIKRIKKIIFDIDRYLFRIFGTEKNIKFLENLREAKTIFSYLNEIGKESRVRFVGGCVRKCLYAENIDDIDLATSIEPNDVKKRLSNKDIRIIDTGISHGTITAIFNEIKFEITTLRKDIWTDGRHAEVQFTENWKQDALRRDFTINAIYADIDGQIFDPLNGMSDLENGIIKFVGSPEERIKEDYLRILRYFRFFTQYSRLEHDKNIIHSIKKNINGINKISNERIFHELEKILSLKNMCSLFSNNESKEIILNIFPQFKYYERLKKIDKLEKNLKEKYDKNLIMSLLIVDQSDGYEYFCHKYKASNSLKNKFKNISKNFESLKNKSFFTEKNIKKLIYFFGKNSVKDLLLFSICSNDKIDILTIEKLLDYVNVCKVPKFPISGDFLKQQGYESGQVLGKKLKSLEEKWIENNFVLDKKILGKSFNKLNQN